MGPAQIDGRPEKKSEKPCGGLLRCFVFATGGGRSSTGVLPGTEALPSSTSTTSETQTGSESSTSGSGTRAPDTCGDTPEESFALSDGTIAVKGGLCDTRLYFNRGDLDGTQAQCEGSEDGTPQNTFGPCFSRSNNSPCPFDDPDGSGFGPNQQIPGDEEAGLGFGRALGLNTGAPNTGENHLMLLVR